VSINNIIKIKKRTFAMEANPAAIPPNPKIAAITAMIKNPIAQRNIFFMVLVNNSFYE